MISAERHVRLLLRAWPRPDRIERGEEIVTTTLRWISYLTAETGSP
jgi:hypothetical protein